MALLIMTVCTVLFEKPYKSKKSKKDKKSPGGKT